MAPELIRDRVLYFYGVTESSPENSIQQPGVDFESKVETIECQGFTCWVSLVSAAEFEEDLARNMENLDWLANASVAHQRAISSIAREVEILPARFGTVFRSEDSLRKHIRAQARDIARDFKRIRGADEWGVKVFSRKATAPPTPQVRSGKDYLKAKAALRPRKSSRTDKAGEFAEFERALRQVALESAAAGKVSAGQRGLRFQTSLLVKRKDRKKLESVLKKFSQRWAAARQIECSGPWPPYSFVSRPERQVEPE